MANHVIKVFIVSISASVYYLSLIAIVIPFYYWIYREGTHHSKNLNKIDGLLEKVEKGEPLSSLKELKEK